MTNMKHTVLGTGALARGSTPECPRCQAPTGAWPFCPRDGTLVAPVPFSVGGRYQVDQCLGSGASALVFGGRHLGLRRGR